MDNIFDNIGKKASKAYKYTTDKTGKIAKETKLKFKMNDLKSQIEEYYTEIGKKVYEKHIQEEKIEIKDDLEELCIKIQVLSDQIEVLLDECRKIKNKKRCSNCYFEIELNDKFCKNCGAEQEVNNSTDESAVEVKEENEIEENMEDIIESRNEKM